MDILREFEQIVFILLFCILAVLFGKFIFRHEKMKKFWKWVLAKLTSIPIHKLKIETQKWTWIKNPEKVKRIVFISSFVGVGIMSYLVSYKIGILYLIILVLMYSIILLISEGFAKNNILWTRPEEGFAVPIFIGDKFYKFVMTFRGKIFATEDKEIYTTPDMTTDEIKKVNENRKKINRLKPYRTSPREKKEKVEELNDDWDVVDDLRKVVEKREKWIPKLLRGVRWVGFPPHRVYVYRFIWISIEDAVDDKGRVKKKLESREEYIHYIILKDDVYIISVDQAETKEMIPLDFTIAFTVRNTNPYKALFKGERWFELLSTQSAARIRLFTGSKGYEDIIHILKEEEKEKNGKKITGEELLLSDKNLGGIITDLKQDYGTWAMKAQILDVNPGSDLAKDFIKAATKEYIAAKQAAADREEGAGLRDRAKRLYGTISEIPGGKDMFIAEQIRNSKITVLSTGGGGIMPAVNVGNVANIPDKQDSEKNQEEDKEVK
jgi:hypothetical protein